MLDQTLMRCRGISLLLLMLAVSVCSAMAADAASGITKEDLRVLIEFTDPTILDVRTETDWKKSDFMIKGALREGPEKVTSWLQKYPKEDTIILYCASPNVSTSAGLAQRLKSKGFKKVYTLSGGWDEWMRSRYPIEGK
ncbi:MAG: rhodanese-related (seleno)protein [bacterium]